MLSLLACTVVHLDFILDLANSVKSRFLHLKTLVILCQQRSCHVSCAPHLSVYIGGKVHPWACLSIPDKQRDVIMALVETRIDPRAVFDDFVAGKGKGLNILLQYGSTPLLLTECADMWK
jgi:hypothetical protein